ncbi:hypothetical protein [Arthrobacter sp.]
MSIVLDEKPAPDAPEVITEAHVFGAAGAQAVLPQPGAARRKRVAEGVA